MLVYEQLVLAFNYMLCAYEPDGCDETRATGTAAAPAAVAESPHVNMFHILRTAAAAAVICM